MLIGTVIGNVWATRKADGLAGMTFLVVREVALDGTPLSAVVVAADAVGAGVGETVLVAQGSSGRQTALTSGKAIDAVVMAIVDRLDVAADPLEAARADTPRAEAARAETARAEAAPRPATRRKAARR